MPPNRIGTMDDLSSDDYVARVLAREARDNSANYARQGAEAYLPRRPTGAAPKPNTRFLRHIIKDVDSHNAALKRKEEREARDKMKQLRRNRLFSMDDHDHDHDHRHRSHRSSDTRESERDRKDDRHHRHSHRRRRRSRSPSGDRERSHKHRRRHDSYDDSSDEDRRHQSSRRSRRRRSYSRSRSPRPRDHESSRHHRRRHRRRSHDSPSRSLSRSRSRSRSPDGDRARRKARDRARGHASSRRLSPSCSESASRRAQPPSEYDSDPLEELVGPLPPKMDPPVRSRGRGAYNLSNIDAHFAADYDPSLDVQPDEEEDTNQPSIGRSRRHVPGLMTAEDDWETSLEAVRDRARWRQQGEDRLREAGFGDDFVQRWKKNTATAAPGDSESRIEDVKWSRKGEGREWDRGKVIDEDGHVELRAPW